MPSFVETIGYHKHIVMRENVSKRCNKEERELKFDSAGLKVSELRSANDRVAFVQG